MDHYWLDFVSQIFTKDVSSSTSHKKTPSLSYHVVIQDYGITGF